MELAAVNREGSVESTGNITTQRTLALVELTSEQPQWFEWTVDLERGEEPEVRFRNGPIRAKRQAFLMSRNGERYPELKAPAAIQNPGERSVALLKVYRGPKLRIWEMQVNGPHLDQWPTRGHALLYANLRPDQINRATIPERLRVFAAAAFRRPLRAGELTPIEALVGAKLDAGMPPLAALQLGFQAILCSPAFLHLHDGTGKLNDHALASRLSYFLWSSLPDAALLQLAADGKLHEPATLSAQVDRMLTDLKSQRFVENFVRLWLNLDNLNDVDPNPQLFPEYSDGLLRDFSEESNRFIASVLLNDQPVPALMTADYTFLNERLAKHYGIDSVYGAQFRRVALKDEHRHGLLGKGAVMLRTSYGDRTSPVLRGNWVLEKLMGTPSAPPPPEVVTDLTVPEGQKPTTLRARMEKHRSNPTCNQCHGVIDPIGLALENFSVTGRWRDRDVQADEAIDATTVMPGNIAIGGPVDLRNELIRKPEKFVRTFTARMLTYSLGRELEYFDMPQVRAIVDAAAAKDYRLFDIVMGIVQSDSFRYQALQHDDEADAVNVANNAN